MNNPTILVVEDEAIVSKDIVKTLEMFQYHPLCAVSTADEAVTRAREYTPDVILMDINIPGSMDGLDAARIIHDELHIPVIFVTSYADDETIIRAKAASPYGYVLKPFSDRDLKVAIEMALSRKTAELLVERNDDPHTGGRGEPRHQDAPADVASLSEIRSLLMENIFQDLTLLLYNNAVEKELVLASCLEKSIKTMGETLFAYSISKAHRDFLQEIQDGKIHVCRMKEGETSALKRVLFDFFERTDIPLATPRKIIIDFSEPFQEADILFITDFILERKNRGIPVVGMIAVLVRTHDDNLVKTLSKKIKKVLITTNRSSVISCADYSFPFEHLSFLPQPVIDEIVRKVLEPIILSLLNRPVSGNDILLEIRRRYNVAIPKARIYTYLYSLQEMGYLATSSSGKSILYYPTDCGEKYIREKLNEFNSVFYHIQAEIVNRDSGKIIREQRLDSESP